MATGKHEGSGQREEEDRNEEVDVIFLFEQKGWDSDVHTAR